MINYDSKTIDNEGFICLMIIIMPSNPFIQMCSDLAIDKAYTNYIITKSTSIIIRTTCYILCMNNKAWTNPDLPSY